MKKWLVLAVVIFTIVGLVGGAVPAYAADQGSGTAAKCCGDKTKDACCKGQCKCSDKKECAQKK